MKPALALLLSLAGSVLAQNADGLAPEVTDLNAEDVSYALEAKLPDLKHPFLNPRPVDRGDGIAVGELGVDGGDKALVLGFVEEIVRGEHGEVDSLLLCQGGKLLLESYFRRGRANYPHYQMSITKSYTAMAIGRAIQLGHLTMEDLDRPLAHLLKELDPGEFVEGAAEITLAAAMNMRSGIRIDEDTARRLRRKPDLLKGQGQVQAYLSHSAPIPPTPRAFKYQGSDPSITMQVLEAAVPGSAKEFLKTEVLGRMGITSYAWQEDISGLPKAAAGSSLRSRDMLKWGLLLRNLGRWKDKQLVPAAFIERATGRIHTNPQRTSYGYFWWQHEMEVGGRKLVCHSGRGAGGQFILFLPDLDLIAVVTAHNKGMGDMLKSIPEQLLPAFLD